MSNDFYSFERVLRELQMEEEELKRLVSEGEIRAFRDDDKMKFRREDISRFQDMSGDTQDTLGDEDLPEELVFDDDDADQEVGMATAAIDDAFLEEDEPLQLEEEAPASTGRKSSRARPSATASVARKPRVMTDEPDETEGPAWVAALVLSALLMAFGGLVVADAVAAKQTDLSAGISDWVDDTFIENGNPTADAKKKPKNTEEP